MASMEAYPRAAMERAMKVQDVLLQAMAKKITWWQAAEILGISDRHMRRWRERYVKEGYNGLLDRRRGRPSRRRVPVATVEKVFALYREKYFDLNERHFHEKLRAEHGIELSYTWVKQALQGAGLVARGRKRGAHRKRRERRPLPGMLLHIDGSRHHWFQDERSRRRSKRNFRFHRGSSPWCAIELKRPAQLQHAFSHVDHPQPSRSS